MMRRRSVIAAIWLAGAALILVVTATASSAAPVLPPLKLAWAVLEVRRGECDAVLPELHSLSDEAGPTGGRASYLLAHCLLQHGDVEAARQVFGQVAERFPPLADHARLYAAQSALQAGQSEEAALRLAQLLAATTIQPVARRARLMYADALIKAGEPEKAVVSLSRLLAEPLDDESYARTWWLLGQAAEGAGDRFLAIRAYAMAWWSVPDVAEADAAYQRLRDLQPDQIPVPPADARLQRAGRLVAAGEFAVAERELAEALHQPSTPEIAAEAWYRLGILRLRTRGAVYAFQQSAGIPGQHRPRALFWLGRALASDDRDREALAVWRRLADEDPESAWAPRAMLSLAAITELHGNLPGAQQWLSRASRRYPDSAAADEARWRLGWLAFRQGRIRDAEQQFLNSATRFAATPRAAANLFWAAKARARRGADARALLIEVARRYPLTFYGWRALELTGGPEPALQSAPAAVRLGDGRASLPYEELAALGFDEDAVEIVETYLDASADIPVLQTAAWLWGRMEVYHRSVAAAERAIRPTLREGTIADRELWMLAYPLAYWNDLRRVAEEEHIDPYLVLAVMREESRFNPRVVSLAGAVGLTQLLPSTASAVAGTEMLPAQLMDAETNITIGTRYLAGLMRRYKGDTILALAAYNAGPGAARRIARLPRADLDVFLERIPISETRAYVQHVLQSYRIYRWLYQ